MPKPSSVMSTGAESPAIRRLMAVGGKVSQQVNAMPHPSRTSVLMTALTTRRGFLRPGRKSFLLLFFKKDVLF
jgi:hypothetical protein